MALFTKQELRDRHGLTEVEFRIAVDAFLFTVSSPDASAENLTAAANPAFQSPTARVWSYGVTLGGQPLDPADVTRLVRDAAHLCLPGRHKNSFATPEAADAADRWVSLRHPTAPRPFLGATFNLCRELLSWAAAGVLPLDKSFLHGGNSSIDSLFGYDLARGHLDRLWRTCLRAGKFKTHSFGSYSELLVAASAPSSGFGSPVLVASHVPATQTAFTPEEILGFRIYPTPADASLPMGLDNLIWTIYPPEGYVPFGYRTRPGRRTGTKLSADSRAIARSRSTLTRARNVAEFKSRWLNDPAVQEAMPLETLPPRLRPSYRERAEAAKRRWLQDEEYRKAHPLETLTRLQRPTYHERKMAGIVPPRDYLTTPDEPEAAENPAE